MNPVIINQAGPLPIRTTIPWPSSNTIVVAVSGSAWAQKANTMLTVNVTIEGAVVGVLQQFANAATTHLAFPTAFIALQTQWREATVTLSAANSATVTDQNDNFTVALIY